MLPLCFLSRYKLPPWEPKGLAQLPMPPLLIPPSRHAMKIIRMFRLITLVLLRDDDRIRYYASDFFYFFSPFCLHVLITSLFCASHISHSFSLSKYFCLMFSNCIPTCILYTPHSNVLEQLTLMSVSQHVNARWSYVSPWACMSMSYYCRFILTPQTSKPSSQVQPSWSWGYNKAFWRMELCYHSTISNPHGHGMPTPNDHELPGYEFIIWHPAIPVRGPEIFGKGQKPKMALIIREKWGKGYFFDANVLREWWYLGASWDWFG